MSFEEALILMDFAFFHPVATIQVITCSQFVHSHFMEVTTFNVIYIWLDLVRMVGVLQQ